MAYGRVNVEGVNLSEIEKIQQSLESINGLIGKTNDTGGTATTGTVIAKLNKLLTDWTTTRAGYISTINTNAARLTSARATKIDNIGATGDTGGTATAGTLMAKVNALLSTGGSAGLKIKSIQHGYAAPGEYRTSGGGIVTEVDTNQYRKIKINTVNASKAILLNFSEISMSGTGTAINPSYLNKVPILYNTYLLQPFYTRYVVSSATGSWAYCYTGFSYYVIEFQ